MCVAPAEHTVAGKLLRLNPATRAGMNVARAQQDVTGATALGEQLRADVSAKDALMRKPAPADDLTSQAMRDIELDELRRARGGSRQLAFQGGSGAPSLISSKHLLGR